MQLLLYPDKRLLVPSEPVTLDELHELGDTFSEMMVKCAEWRGHALAAPQVGIPKRFFVIHRSPALESCLTKLTNNTVTEAPWFPQVIVNPQIVESSGTFQYKESCLSMPGVSASLARPAFLRLRFIDVIGHEQELSCGGLLARVIFHELDHLDGKMFVERLDFFTKNKIIGAINKLRRKATNRKDTIEIK
jgi:peptide deformylase